MNRPELVSTASAHRVALFGFGPWGRRLAAALDAEPTCALVAIVEPDPARRAEAQAAWNGRTIAESTDHLNPTAYDVAVIAVAPAHNGSVALEQLALGKHVFVEKPMAMDLEVARAIRREAERRNLTVGVGHVTRHQAAVRRAVELVRAGWVGRLTGLSSQRTGARPRPGLSPWWVLAPHDLSFGLSLLGPLWVGVEANRSPAGMSVAYDLRSGERLVVTVGNGGARTRRTAITGTEGLLLLDELAGALWYGREARPADVLPAALWRQPGRFGLSPCEIPPSGDALQDQLAAYFDSLRTGAPLETGIDDGVHVVRALVDGWRELEGTASAEDWSRSEPALAP